MANQDVVKGTWPKADEVMCKTCLWRDRTTVNLDGKEIPVGVTKQFCDIYGEPPESNGKPTGILFQGELCEFYEHDDELKEE